MNIRDKKATLRQQLIQFQKQIASLQHDIKEQEKNFQSRQLAVFQDIFEVLDAFEHVEGTLAAKEGDMDKSMLFLAKNVRSIHKKLRRVLKKNSIEPLQFPDGQADMTTCKILETQPAPEMTEGTIISVLKTGYIDNHSQEVLRKAEVITVHNK